MQQVFISLLFIFFSFFSFVQDTLKLTLRKADSLLSISQTFRIAVQRNKAVQLVQIVSLRKSSRFENCKNADNLPRTEQKITKNFGTTYIKNGVQANEKIISKNPLFIYDALT